MPQGEFQLPLKEELEADVARKQAWRASLMPAHNFRAGRLGHVGKMLCDELLLDMGFQRFRKVCVALVNWGLGFRV